MIKVAHIITGLGTGGAEMTLAKLLTHQDRSRFESEVISLTAFGPVGEKIQAAGFPVRCLGMSRSVRTLLAPVRLVRWLRAFCPDIVQTWMYHADLLGGLAAFLAGQPPVVWNLRASLLTYPGLKRTTLLCAWACAQLSRPVPTRIICCSEASRRAHLGLGYLEQKLVLIQNGFDLTARPDPASRIHIRQELNIPLDGPVVGLVARFDPLKDHRTFVEAARFCHQQRSDSYFLLCGDGITWDNSELRGWIDAAGLRERFRLLGRRDDVPRVNSALDVFSLTSYSEGFPNVVGEAMACGIPCVVTDVGDSALLVADTGLVVPPRNPQALSSAWLQLLNAEPQERTLLGQRARERIENQFSVQAVVRRYEQVYEELCKPR